MADLESIRHASMAGMTRKVELLLRYNGDLLNSRDWKQRTPLIWAVIGGHIELINYLFKKNADQLVVDVDGFTLIHHAVRASQQTLVFILTNSCVPVNEKSLFGATALHLAVQSEKLEAIDTLLRNGADINEQNIDGDTPLHVAAGKGFVDIVKLLLDHGALYHIKNKNGRTACDEAGSDEVKCYLEIYQELYPVEGVIFGDNEIGTEVEEVQYISRCERFVQNEDVSDTEVPDNLHLPSPLSSPHQNRVPSAASSSSISRRRSDLDDDDPGNESEVEEEREVDPYDYRNTNGNGATESSSSPRKLPPMPRFDLSVTPSEGKEDASGSEVESENGEGMEIEEGDENNTNIEGQVSDSDDEDVEAEISHFLQNREEERHCDDDDDDNSSVQENIQAEREEEARKKKQILRKHKSFSALISRAMSFTSRRGSSSNNNKKSKPINDTLSAEDQMFEDIYGGGAYEEGESEPTAGPNNTNSSSCPAAAAENDGDRSAKIKKSKSVRLSTKWLTGMFGSSKNN